jgi:hypothetical protein
MEAKQGIGTVIPLVSAQSSDLEHTMMDLLYTRPTIPNLRHLVAVVSRKISIRSLSITKQAELLN